MASTIRWQDPIGRETLNTIVKKMIPACKDGLRDFQQELVCPILDGEHVFCCTATGDGKSSAFFIPIIVLTEYNQHPDLYPKGLRTRINPVGIVITPTKGLALNIVN